MESSVTINLLDLGSKVRSKGELFRLLTHEANLYLPPYKECTIEFITDYLEGKKTVLKTSQVTVKSIPQIDGLRSEDLYGFLVDHCNAETYLPSVKKGRFPNRQWLGNIANSLNPRDLQAFIEDQMEIRQTKILGRRGLTIKVNEDLAKVISTSKSISTINGRSHLMLNTHKREEWRAKKKILNDWQSNQRLLDEMKKEILKLQEEVEENKNQIEQDKQRNDILADLFDKGIIDKDGNIL